MHLEHWQPESRFGHMLVEIVELVEEEGRNTVCRSSSDCGWV
jgi:hypothetical protein